MNKIKIYLFLFFFSILCVSYTFTPVVLHKQETISFFPKEIKKSIFNSNINSLSLTKIKKENHKATYYLNQRYFGVSDYEKAQIELQQFNRPVIGIVGQQDDWLSYQEYQRKIIGSSY